ncbi:hypothetical protein HRbin23_00338 [bacterium HR23]|nr:hypothetical protein HRbin23_00338 [bacterium HR23]
MSQEPMVRFSLCPDCGHCPEVRVYPDRVEIGEEPRIAVLSREQWGVLVEAVRQGNLEGPSAQKGTCPCGCGCPCCG